METFVIEITKKAVWMILWDQLKCPNRLHSCLHNWVIGWFQSSKADSLLLYLINSLCLLLCHFSWYSEELVCCGCSNCNCFWKVVNLNLSLYSESPQEYQPYAVSWIWFTLVWLQGIYWLDFIFGLTMVYAALIMYDDAQVTCPFCQK